MSALRIISSHATEDEEYYTLPIAYCPDDAGNAPAFGRVLPRRDDDKEVVIIDDKHDMLFIDRDYFDAKAIVFAIGQEVAYYWRVAHNELIACTGTVVGIIGDHVDIVAYGDNPDSVHRHFTAIWDKAKFYADQAAIIEAAEKKYPIELIAAIESVAGDSPIKIDVTHLPHRSLHSNSRFRDIVTIANYEDDGNVFESVELTYPDAIQVAQRFLQHAMAGNFVARCLLCKHRFLGGQEVLQAERDYMMPCGHTFNDLQIYAPISGPYTCGCTYGEHGDAPADACRFSLDGLTCGCQCHKWTDDLPALDADMAVDVLH